MIMVITVCSIFSCLWHLLLSFISQLSSVNCQWLLMMICHVIALLMLDNCSAPYGVTTVKQVKLVLLSMVIVKRNCNAMVV